MCTQFGQTCADMQENTRIQLQIFEERNSHLANLIHASNGFIVAILVGVLAFAGSVKGIEIRPYYITLVVVIVVFSLVSWRIYVKWIDKEIVEVYGKILCCEYKLNVDSRTSLLMSLIKKQPPKQCEDLMNLIKTNQATKAYNEMFLLIKEGNVGSRGHGALDTIAIFLTLATIIIGFFVIFSILPLNDSAIIGAIFGILIGCLATLIILFKYLPIAKNMA